MMIYKIILIISLLMSLFCMTMLIRNNLVHSRRRKFLDFIFSQPENEQTGYLLEYDEVSYKEMMWKFWVPISSYYKEYLND